MPPINIWTHLPVVFAVILLVGSVLFPFHKIKNKWIYCFCSLILIFVVWLTSAQQEQKNNVDDLDKKMMKKDLHEISLQNTELQKGNEELKSELRDIAAAINVNSNQAPKDLVQQILKKINKRNIDSLTSQKMVEELKNAGHQSIVINAVLGDTESYQYATKLASLLNAAGWNVTGPGQTSQPAEGLIVYIKSNDYAHFSADLLRKTFEKYNIPTTGNIDSSLPTGSIGLLVGSKP